MPVLFRNATLIAMDPQHGADSFTADLLVADGLIAGIGPDLACPPGTEIIDACEKLIMPGLVNAHTHSAEMFFRGRYERLPLELWLLYAYPFLRAGPPPPRVLYLRSMLLAIESIRSGVTTLVDHFFDPPQHDLARLGQAVRAYDDIGVRATVSSAVMNIHPLDALPLARDIVPPALQELLAFGPPISPEVYIDYCRSAHEAFHGRSGRISFMVAPSAPQRCTPALMQSCRDFATAHRIPYHSHVLETKLQAITGRLHYGGSLIAYMNDLGLLGPGTTIAHGVWLDDADIDMLGQAGVSVVHNIIANLKLGSGIAPVRKLMAAGVNVALGSDGASSNDTVRIFDAMRVAALIHSTPDRPHGQWLAAAEVLHMATINGARSAGQGLVTGSLEVGKAADLIVLDLKALAFTPRNSLANHVIYAENGSSIERVMIAGTTVLLNGRITTIDEHAILAEIREMIPGFLAAHALDEARNAVFHDSFAEMHRRASLM